MASGVAGAPGPLLERLSQVPQLQWGHHAGGSVPRSPQGVWQGRLWQNTGEFPVACPTQQHFTRVFLLCLGYMLFLFDSRQSNNTRCVGLFALD